MMIAVEAYRAICDCFRSADSYVKDKIEIQKEKLTFGCQVD